MHLSHSIFRHRSTWLSEKQHQAQTQGIPCLHHQTTLYHQQHKSRLVPPHEPAGPMRVEIKYSSFGGAQDPFAEKSQPCSPICSRHLQVRFHMPHAVQRRSLAAKGEEASPSDSPRGEVEVSRGPFPSPSCSIAYSCICLDMPSSPLQTSLVVREPVSKFVALLAAALRLHGPILFLPDPIFPRQHVFPFFFLLGFFL